MSPAQRKRVLQTIFKELVMRNGTLEAAVRSRTGFLTSGANRSFEQGTLDL